MLAVTSLFLLEKGGCIHQLPLQKSTKKGTHKKRGQIYLPVPFTIFKPEKNLLHPHPFIASISIFATSEKIWGHLSLYVLPPF